MKALLATGIFYNDFSGFKICIVVVCYATVWFGRTVPPFLQNMHPPALGQPSSRLVLKLRAVVSQMLVPTTHSGYCHSVTLFTSRGYGEEVQV
jgi:hypothetical protein